MQVSLLWDTGAWFVVILFVSTVEVIVKVSLNSYTHEPSITRDRIKM